MRKKVLPVAAGMHGQGCCCQPSAPKTHPQAHIAFHAPILGLLRVQPPTVKRQLSCANAFPQSVTVNDSTHLPSGTARRRVKGPSRDDAGLTQRLGNIRPDDVAAHNCGGREHHTAQLGGWVGWGKWGTGWVVLDRWAAVEGRG